MKSKLFAPPRSILDFNSWYRQHEVLLLRIAVGVVFIWFGSLKILDMSPVMKMLASSFSFLAAPPGLILLGIFEVILGVGLLVPATARLAAALTVLHLIGTFSLFLIAPSVLFHPSFPIVTFEGEFVVKNIVLITALLAIFTRQNS